MRLGIVFGGQSFEHEISIVSAISLKNVLKNEPIFIFCDQNRIFYLIESKNMRAKFFSSKEYKKSKILNISNGGFFINGIFSKKKVEADVFINLIHGCDGEDGKIAALFEFFGISYIGPGIEASVMSYNKALTKLLAKQANVKTLKYEIIHRSNLISLEYPVILKPCRLGSSIGISVVNNNEEVDYAMDVAFEYDDFVIAEPFIKNIKEYNLAGCKIGKEMVYSIIEEPVKKDILDFTQKYMDFSREERVKEANIDQDIKEKMKEAFYKIYNSGFDGALIRCDFFVIDNEVYLNEINPNPGSMANYLFEDFNTTINSLAKNLPKKKQIRVKYKYINSITSNK